MFSGATDCFLTTGPCGGDSLDFLLTNIWLTFLSGRPASLPKSIIATGSNASIIYMKNVWDLLFFHLTR